MALGPRGMKFFLNLYPPYLFTRTCIRYIAPDWREVVVQLKKSFLTRNYVGTAFGGSLYAATDPMFMLMLVKILGIREHIIWDKGAEVDFKKPGRTTITYHFRVTDDDLRKIYDELAAKGKTVAEFFAEGKDESGDVCIRVKKFVYVRKKEA